MDTTGLIMAVAVHSAVIHDRDGARLLNKCKGLFPRLELIWADQGDAGKLLGWIRDELGVVMQVVYPWWRQLQRDLPEVLERMGFDLDGFHVLPRRWVVERTFAWLMFQRRLAPDDEWLEATTESLVYIAMIRLMLRRTAA